MAAGMDFKRYDGVDDLRVYAMTGIVLMHVQFNGNYELDGFVFHQLIPSFTDFVFLFMMISGFCMCCGYFDKLREHQITIEDFYTKRYAKIWPFFAMLCLLDWMISPDVNAFYEVFANLTLCFGLLPNVNFRVIGVGWALGVIFVFYLLFPFFCYLLGNKRRAWLALAAALVFNILCEIYFFDADHVLEGVQARRSFIYCAVYFIAGGLLYLYKESLSGLAEKYRWVIIVCCIVSIVLYFTIGASTGTRLFVNVSLIVSIMGKNGRRRGGYGMFMKLMGSISFEIYLCHMVIYRILEKMCLLHACESELLSYCMVAAGTMCGAILFALYSRYFLNIVSRLYHERIRGHQKP